MQILIRGWANSQNKLRLNRIIRELEVRTRTVATALYEFDERQKREKEEAGRQYVMLFCQRWECRFGPDAIGTGVMLKDYEPAKYKCEKCGGELSTEEDHAIDAMLWDVGIFLNT